MSDSGPGSIRDAVTAALTAGGHQASIGDLEPGFEVYDMIRAQASVMVGHVPTITEAAAASVGDTPAEWDQMRARGAERYATTLRSAGWTAQWDDKLKALVATPPARQRRESEQA